MNEGPGHVPLHKIPENMRNQLVSSTTNFIVLYYAIHNLLYSGAVWHLCCAAYVWQYAMSYYMNGLVNCGVLCYGMQCGVLPHIA
jgi:hypothetical protein